MISLHQHAYLHRMTDRWENSCIFQVFLAIFFVYYSICELWELISFVWTVLKFVCIPNEVSQFTHSWKRSGVIGLPLLILWDLTSVGEGNEAFLIRVWKSLSSRRVLKLWGWWWYVTGQSEQYLQAVGFACYKWYEMQTPDVMPARTLDPQKGWIVRSHIGWSGEWSVHYNGVETSP